MNTNSGKYMYEISVIVPVYNVEKYIKRTLKSICEQSFTDFEIVLVNDGTKDKSIEIAENLLKEYPTVIYKIIHQNNKGLAAARNSGIKQSNGKYVCFIDSDDYISKIHLSTLYAVTNENNLAVAHSEFEVVHNSNYQGTKDNNIYSSVITQNNLFYSFMKRTPAIHCCSLLISRDLLLKKRLYFNESLRYGEDTEFMWRLFSYIDFIGLTKNRSYKYLTNDNGIMNSISKEKGYIYSKIFKETMDDLSIRYTHNRKYYNQVYYRSIMGLLHVYATTHSYNGFKELYLKLGMQKELFLCLKGFPDNKIKVLSLILYCTPKVFYFIFKEKRI